jgi:hypothetical protein
MLVLSLAAIQQLSPHLLATPLVEVLRGLKWLAVG